MKWTRSKEFGVYIAHGLKNSKNEHDIKCQIIQPEINDLLLQFKEKYNCESGLLFPRSPDCAQPLSFRYIQYNYDLAFQKAGIKFSGTHVLRHGGNRHDLNSHGDMTIAQVRLGNRSMSATEVYSARDTRALDSFTLKKYDLIKNALSKNKEPSLQIAAAEDSKNNVS